MAEPFKCHAKAEEILFAATELGQDAGSHRYFIPARASPTVCEKWPGLFRVSGG